MKIQKSQRVGDNPGAVSNESVVRIIVVSMGRFGRSGSRYFIMMIPM
jgi:hypothetical protein